MPSSNERSDLSSSSRRGDRREHRHHGNDYYYYEYEYGPNPLALYYLTRPYGGYYGYGLGRYGYGPGLGPGFGPGLGYGRPYGPWLW